MLGTTTPFTSVHRYVILDFHSIVRCLMKNLEGLCVEYDYTVRDKADGSIIQFYYGEDGIDVENVEFLNNFNFVARNSKGLTSNHEIKESKQLQSIDGMYRPVLTPRQLYVAVFPLYCPARH